MRKCHIRQLLFLVAVAISMFKMQPVWSQSQPFCEKRDAILTSLFRDYGEMLSYRALTGDNHMIELTVNTDKGTWTLLRTFTDGVTCVAGSGENWRVLVPTPLGDPM